jgi:hypothetical protein
MGPIEKRTVTELLFGFAQETIQNRINTGDVADGNIYINAGLITPVFLDHNVSSGSPYQIDTPTLTVSAGNTDLSS